jgi:hypothetical protein
VSDENAGEHPPDIAGGVLPPGHDLATDIWRGTADLSRRIRCTPRHARYLLGKDRVPGATKEPGGRGWIGRISRLREMVDR